MDRITRKSLKQDRFATEVTESVEYLAEHRRQAILYGGIAVVVLALGFGIYFYRQYHNRLIHDALARALETYRALVSDQDVPGRITFRTEQEKDAQALHQFEAVDRDYHRSPEARSPATTLGSSTTTWAAPPTPKSNWSGWPTRAKAPFPRSRNSPWRKSTWRKARTRKRARSTNFC